MANIHGYGDPDQAAQGRADRGLFEYDEAPNKSPHQENYFEMMRFTLFPKLTLTSFCTIVVILDTIIFLAQCFVDGIETKKELLEVKLNGPII